MIMREWHKLVFLVIIIVNKPTAPHDFRWISPFFRQQSLKCQFFGQRTTPKITLINRHFLIQIIVQK